ncbi:MAG: UDP-2,4-diacetamido-2,4,6-trideoxy-beta-L-altropyranose hydrolase [Candidatus Omnitrophica bacterium]|nr:UDP-2,4-diacetamido-2,4,6-trideoxy-beta-L-altropyranose hydrolase [Candidatus Omnitrophota bacterium]
MNVFILTEAGQKVGFGHLSRCSGVYDAFVKRGIKPRMIVNGDDGVREFLKGVRHEIFDWLESFQELLSRIAGADIVLIDSYLADQDKYHDIAATVSLVACVDDYKRIRYPQGVVINGLIYAPQMKYPRVKDIEYLLGTRYAFLRKAFWDATRKEISAQVKNVFVTFGGSDFLNLAPSTLTKLIKHYPDIQKTLVVSRFYNNIPAIQKAADCHTKIVVDVSDREMRKLMLKADVAISASGQTLSELAILGVPGVAVCVAENQRRNWKAWTSRGFVAAEPNADSVVEGLQKLKLRQVRQKSSAQLRQSISSSGVLAIVDAVIRKASQVRKNRQHAAQRFEIRKVKKEDCRDIWLWRNTHQARRASFQSETISYNQHEQWFQKKLSDRNSQLWMAETPGKKIGYVRHDTEENQAVSSIVLNPQFYGMGLGTKVISAADRRFLKLKKVPRVICAEIQNNHPASIQAFLSAGYRLKKRIVRNGKKAGVYQWQS